MTTNRFFSDVWKGLHQSPKRLYSKYFYDEVGDAIFREIMACPQYYPTRCELEIFAGQTGSLVQALTSRLSQFDVVELGAGDATKSRHLLRGLLDSGAGFRYLPIDISGNVISLLHSELPEALPDLQMQGLQGEYFDMLEKAKTLSSNNKVVLFLGSNIGNTPVEESDDFLKELRSHLSTGDLLLTGFDLKKDPQTILDAYHDKEGITRRFNLNLLQRINRELDGNFDLSKFVHYPVYDPVSGACKSYLVSTEEQEVCLGEEHCISFEKNEPVFMEISQKYTTRQIEEMAGRNGFRPLQYFYDSRQWFTDALWQCV